MVLETLLALQDSRSCKFKEQRDQ